VDLIDSSVPTLATAPSIVSNCFPIWHKALELASVQVGVHRNVGLGHNLPFQTIPSTVLKVGFGMFAANQISG
jgi:hypothetical protein